MSNLRRPGLEENINSLSLNLSQEGSYTLASPVFKISDVSSSPCSFQTRPGHLDLSVPHISDHPGVDSPSSVKLIMTSSDDTGTAANLGFQRFSDASAEHQQKTSFQLHIPTAPLLSQSSASTLTPATNRRLRSRSDTSAESSEVISMQMLSPASPSRKYFRASSPSRRGSEPVFDRMTKANIQQLQLSVTDRRWEKLRSILMVMKDEPFDVEKSLKSSSVELLHNLQEKISDQKEMYALQREVSSLQDALIQKEYTLQQVEAERNSALAYIRRLKVNSPGFEDKNFKSYEQGIESLRTPAVTKENVVNLVAPLMRELHEQKSYLDCLMAVVLTRAPWMLDEVDRMELPGRRQSFSCKDDDDDDRGDFYYEDSHDEVWC